MMQNKICEQLDQFFIKQGLLPFVQKNKYQTSLKIFGDGKKHHTVVFSDDHDFQADLSSIFQPFSESLACRGASPNSVAKLVCVALTGIKKLEQPEDQERLYGTLKALLARLTY
nr:hypothetical protein [uncultured Cohaesibacter sp.]